MIKNKNLKVQNKSGFVFIEVFLLLAVVVIMVGGAYFVYQNKANDSSKTPAASSDSTSTSVNTKMINTVKGARSAYTADNKTAFDLYISQDLKSTMKAQGGLDSPYDYLKQPASFGNAGDINFLTYDASVAKFGKIDGQTATESYAVSGSTVTLTMTVTIPDGYGIVGSKSDSNLTYELSPGGTGWVINDFGGDSNYIGN